MSGVPTSECHVLMVGNWEMLLKQYSNNRTRLGIWKEYCLYADTFLERISLESSLLSVSGDRVAQIPSWYSRANSISYTPEVIAA